MGIALGRGLQNTLDIVNGCSGLNTAASICYNLVLNGYDDWYLPIYNKLLKLYYNHQAIGGFTNHFYWCSTEYSADFASLIALTESHIFLNGTLNMFGQSDHFNNPLLK